MRTPSKGPSIGEDDRLRLGESKSLGKVLMLDGFGEDAPENVSLTLNRPFFTSGSTPCSASLEETPRPWRLCPESAADNADGPGDVTGGSIACSSGACGMTGDDMPEELSSTTNRDFLKGFSAAWLVCGVLACDEDVSSGNAPIAFSSVFNLRPLLVVDCDRAVDTEG